MYRRIFQRSWREIFQYPEMVLPDVCGLILTIILGLLALHFSGLLGLVLDFQLAAEEKLAGLISYFVEDSGNLVRFFASLAFFSFTTFFLGTGFQVVKYVMFMDAARGKKPGFLRSFIGANRRYYWRFIVLKIAVFLLLAAGFLIALLVSLPLGMYSREAGVGLFILVFIALFAYLMMGVLFAYPMLFLEDIRIRDALRKSFLIGKTHWRKVIATGLISIGIILAAQIVIRILLIPVQEYAVLEFVLNSFLALIPGLWVSYFIFLMCAELRVKALRRSTR